MENGFGKQVPLLIVKLYSIGRYTRGSPLLEFLTLGEFRVSAPRLSPMTEGFVILHLWGLGFRV